MILNICFYLYALPLHRSYILYRCIRGKLEKNYTTVEQGQTLWCYFPVKQIFLMPVAHTAMINYCILDYNLWADRTVRLL